MWNLPTLCPPANRSQCPPNESTPGEAAPGRVDAEHFFNSVREFKQILRSKSWLLLRSKS